MLSQQSSSARCQMCNPLPLSLLFSSCVSLGAASLITSVGRAVRGPVPGLQASSVELAVLEAAQLSLQRGLLAFKLSFAFPEGRSPRLGSSLPSSRRARGRADPERGGSIGRFSQSLAIRKRLSQNRAIARPGRSWDEMFRSASLSRLLGRF